MELSALERLKCPIYLKRGKWCLHFSFLFFVVVVVLLFVLLLLFFFFFFFCCFFFLGGGGLSYPFDTSR